MLAGAADELGRGVKTHRLAVQKRRRERGRVVTFQPGRHVDQKRETGRVRFGETVVAKTADLAKHRFGIRWREPGRAHPFDQLHAELLDQARPSPGPHRPAELVGLAGREAGGHHRQAHRLLLEQRHAERLFEHLADRLVGIRHRLLPVPATQVRMDHVSLDRPRTHNGHLDHQVVETSRLESRKHAHLGAALDLEHAHRVGSADHGIHLGIALGHVGQGQLAAIVLADQIETLADRREHAQGQAVDLEDPQLVQVVFVPLDHGPVGHGRVFDGHQLRERRASDHHPAGVLRKVTRETDQLVDQLDQLAACLGVGIDPDLAASLRQVRLFVKMLDPFGQPVDPIERKPQGLAHVADGRAGPIGDHLGRHPGPLASVLLVKILQNLFPTLVLEVDVDVRRFVPLLADEPLEQEVDAVRIDRRHAQRVADGRVGRRAASLAQNPPTPGKPDQVPNGQKIGLVAKRFDQRKLVLQEPPHLFGHALRITLFRPGPSEPAQVFDRPLPSGHQFFGILVTQLIERKRRAVGDFDRPPNRLRRPGEQGGRLLPRFQAPLGVGEEMLPGFVDRRPVPDGREHVVESLPLRHVVVHVASRRQRYARATRPLDQTFQLRPIVRTAVQFRQEIAAIGE